MEHLYTPWRMAYIRGEVRSPSREGCIFCEAPGLPDDSSLVVGQSAHVYVIMNAYPYNNGHVMVVPFGHVESQENLSDAALLDLMQTANFVLGLLRSLYRPAAFNIGANIGAAAGAGIAGHFHLHIVPRWNGDVNFMTVTAETRVIADTVQNTRRELRALWRQTHIPESREYDE